MIKAIVYDVNGKFFDGKDAYEKAFEYAKETHTPIFRQIFMGEQIINQFFATRGMFLDEELYTPEKVFVF